VKFSEPSNNSRMGKLQGADSVPADGYKLGWIQLTLRLVNLFSLNWCEEDVPQDYKDASIIHLYKRKGVHACCANHRGISLLSVAGKVLARVLLNRLTQHVDELGILPESQCGFRTGRSTTDMIFSAHQLQEKCLEQYKDLYLIFIHLTKAFQLLSYSQYSGSWFRCLPIRIYH